MKSIACILILTVLFCACSSEREAPNGMKIKVLRDGKGSFAKPGEFLVTRMIIKDAKDSIWRDTNSQGIPMIIPVAEEKAMANEKGVESAFRVMKLGDSVSLDIDVKTLFGDQQLPPKLKPEDKLTYVFVVKDISDEAGVTRIQQQIQQQQMMEAQKMAAGQLTIDTVAIDTYLAANNIQAQRDPSGLRYVIKRMGKGPRPTIESTIKVLYKGTLLSDGTMFDQATSPVEWPLTQLVQGWQIGFPLLPKGSTATFYIPSTLGYGQTGYYPDIPPNANLIFEVELIDFTN